MTASIVRLSLGRGILQFHCPMCGCAVVEEEAGLSNELCPHVAFIVDWIDELLVGPAVAEELGQSAQSLFDDEGYDGVEALARIMPPSVVIFELSEPSRGGGHTGSCITIAVDFAAGSDVDA